MSELRQRLDALSPRQRALLARKLGRRQAELQRGIPRAPRGGEGFPLSFAQERAWGLSAGKLGLWLRAAFDPEALRRALELVVERHEALRTRFHQVGERLEQRPGPAPELALPLRRRPPSLSERAHLDEVSAELMAAPFALEEGPLYRFVLLETERPEVYTFIAVFHPLIFDVASERVFLAELARTYLTLRGGARPEMPPLALQVVDHAVWERQGGEERWAKGLNALEARLRGAPSALELDCLRPSSGAGEASLPLRVAPDRVRALRELGVRSGGSLQTALLAAFAALLQRHCAQEALVIGVPVATRGADPELRNLLGRLTNTLPLRVDLRGQAELQELLERVNEVSREALAHAELPLQLLLGRLQRTEPLFQVGFELQEGMALPEDLGLPVEALGRLASRRGDELLLNLVLAEEAGALVGRLEYDAARLDGDGASAMLEELQALLNAAGALP